MVKNYWYRKLRHQHSVSTNSGTTPDQSNPHSNDRHTIPSEEVPTPTDVPPPDRLPPLPQLPQLPPIPDLSLLVEGGAPADSSGAAGSGGAAPQPVRQSNRRGGRRPAGTRRSVDGPPGDLHAVQHRGKPLEAMTKRRVAHGALPEALAQPEREGGANGGAGPDVPSLKVRSRPRLRMRWPAGLRRLAWGPTGRMTAGRFTHAAPGRPGETSAVHPGERSSGCGGAREERRGGPGRCAGRADGLGGASEGSTGAGAAGGKRRRRRPESGAG